MLKWMMLVLYLLFVSYLLWRSVRWSRRVFPLAKKKRIFIPSNIVFILVASTLLLGGLLPKSPVQRQLRIFSNYWLAFFIYMATYTLIADIILLLFLLIDKKLKTSTQFKKRGYTLIGFVVLLLTVGCTGYGLIHAKKIYLNSYETTVDKKAGNVSDLNIVLLGDLHLGYSIGCNVIEETVEKVNALNPDLVLIAGDIYDNDFDALDDPERLASILSGMKSTYGTYAVYGNHDVDELLIGGFPTGNGAHAYRDERLVDFVEKAGFHMLEDEIELVDDSFYIIGRIDEERDGKGTKIRKEIEELTEGLDQEKPVLVLTHEPSEFDETAAAGVDLLFCGHTHAGQFFPLTIAQPIKWRNYWGHLRVEDSLDTYVTSGIGIYGPDVRVGTDAEVMQINVSFQS